MKKADWIFRDYYSDWLPLCPSAGRIMEKLQARGEVIVNDHLALRTLASQDFGVERLAQPFIEAGYQYKADYKFKEKKLRARHLEHVSDKDAPRVFISELEWTNFPPELQEQCKLILDAMHRHLASRANDIGWAGRVWTFDSDVYDRLYSMSEYAAWFYAFGLRANHFTISLNHLKGFNTIADLNTWLKAEGFILNSSGGEIKGRPEDMLIQSSIMSDEVAVISEKSGLRRKIPGCYFEFAHRLKDKDGNLFGGFVEKSADKIFESTKAK